MGVKGGNLKVQISREDSQILHMGCGYSLGICEGNWRIQTSLSAECRYSSELGRAYGWFKFLMAGIPSFHRNLCGELEDSKFPIPRMPLFHGKLGGEWQDSKIPMPRMQFFHNFGGNFGGVLEESQFLTPGMPLFLGNLRKMQDG